MSRAASFARFLHFTEQKRLPEWPFGCGTTISSHPVAAHRGRPSRGSRSSPFANRLRCRSTRVVRRRSYDASHADRVASNTRLHGRRLIDIRDARDDTEDRRDPRVPERVAGATMTSESFEEMLRGRAHAPHGT
jgi:hypothetical protein